MGSVFGDYFVVATWGESHGEAIGAVIDGCPAGLLLCEGDIQPMLNRRRPGLSKNATSRAEPDLVRILSGVFDGKTTGAPISLIISNTDMRPGDYAALANIFRPGHADFTYHKKYGHRDYRGGGRASGRETAARVAAGAIAIKILAKLDIHIDAQVIQINENLDEIKKQGDSIGSRAECVIRGIKAGFGNPVFGGLRAELAAAIMSIGGAMAIEFGAGAASADMRGSDFNDLAMATAATNSGGMLGGISHGGEIRFTTTFKPPSSIARPQQTIDTSGRPAEIAIAGRHDPIIAPRACPVIEAMSALVLINAIFARTRDRMEYLENFYREFC